MLRDMAGLYPVGEYHVFYEGSGTILYSGAATLISSTPGHDVINVGY